tara:strand:- start:2572 stop:2823 length:252 start_codon:yes stop_codon:yes gene_type:complete
VTTILVILSNKLFTAREIVWQMDGGWLSAVVPGHRFVPGLIGHLEPSADHNYVLLKNQHPADILAGHCGFDWSMAGWSDFAND